MDLDDQRIARQLQLLLHLFRQYHCRQGSTFVRCQQNRGLLSDLIWQLDALIYLLQPAHLLPVHEIVEIDQYFLLGTQLSEEEDRESATCLLNLPYHLYDRPRRPTD